MSQSKRHPEPEGLKLPLCGVESHAHLDVDEMKGDLDLLLERARASGIARLGNVFLGSEAYLKGRALFKNHPEVFFIAGVHPCDAGHFTPAEAAILAEAYHADPRLRAFGEIGLDYHWDDASPEDQERCLREQLTMARQLDAPVVIHCRDAFKPCLAILDSEGFRNRPLLWHCFNGDKAMAREILAHGWHVSIPGTVTYRKNEAMRQAVAIIPDNRLLIETDSPYLTPDPWRGHTNQPAYLAFTAATVAQIRDIPPADIWRITGQNAVRFFGLDPIA